MSDVDVVHGSFSPLPCFYLLLFSTPALPVILNISSPGTVMSGEQAILTCTVNGMPLDQVKVNWIFERIPIPDSGSEKYTTSILSSDFVHQLVINSLNAHDTGTYYCIAFHQLLPNEPPIRRSVQLNVTRKLLLHCVCACVCVCQAGVCVCQAGDEQPGTAILPSVAYGD